MTVRSAPAGSPSLAAAWPRAVPGSPRTCRCPSGFPGRDHHGGARPDRCFLPCPPGVSWGIVRPRQAVAFARRLSAQQGPVPMGADANPPLVDAVDFAETRTHCRSGRRRLNGEPGDDLLFGPGKIHPLEDGLRWLADHPAEAAALLTARQARWRSLTAPAGEGTHPGPAGSLTPSGLPPTGPSSTSAISTTRASLPTATTPWSSPTCRHITTPTPAKTSSNRGRR